jgi:hypothetical protein
VPGVSAWLERMLLTMLSPSPEGRPALTAVQRTLDDEQAELAAEFAELTDRGEDDKDADQQDASDEQAVDRPPTVAAAFVDVEPDAEPAAVAYTVAAESAAAFFSSTDGAVPVTTSPTVPVTTRDSASSGRPQRAVGLLVLSVTAAVSLAIGRATMPRDVTSDAPALAANLADEQIEALVTDERSTPSPRSTPPVSALTGKMLPPTADQPPPAPSVPTSTEVKRQGQPRPVRHDAVSAHEAMTAAQAAVPRLRRCKDVPRSVTIGFKVVRGRGMITSLNEHDPAPEDPRYPWHGCVKQSLERVSFPVSTTISRVQVRLALR